MVVSSTQATQAHGIRTSSRRPLWQRIMRILSVVLPLVSYTVMGIWMSVNKQWLYLIFLIPAVLTQLTSALSQLSPITADNYTARSESSTQSQEDSNSISPLQFFSHNDPQQRPIPSWQLIVHDWLTARDALKHETHMYPAHLGRAEDESKKISDFTLDIIEQGPHALVAGTTGSGKSVLLETWAIDYARHYDPSILNFVFLDFKGGSTFQRLASLPHCAGSVSNLNLLHAKRAIRGLIAEMRRREELLAFHHVSSIDELHEPCAQLIIMADEFFILTREIPQYEQYFSTLISLGRSLGMHFIVCTQNPLNQVNSHIKANMPLHICMRVTDPMQSLDLLSSPVASRIDAHMRGAGFINAPEGPSTFIVDTYADERQLMRNIGKASRFIESPQAHHIFTPPLPDKLTRPYRDVSNASSSPLSHVIIGIMDTGIVTQDYDINLEAHKVIVLTGMSDSDAHLALCSFAQSLTVAGWTMSITDESFTSETEHSVLIHESCDARDIETFVTSRNTTLICFIPSLSRISSQLNTTARNALAHALVLQGNASSLAMPEFGRNLSSETKEIMTDYPTPHPMRAVSFGQSCIFFQFFDPIFDETLEKSLHLWFS
ncbi:FtsK/SpoIIIE domain-containing protein [Alloscardovia venturai]|uniref:FtsK/SpoIIIE domain-containing protein n=1 Tax=Alloscardovia venturai TaxID=1769421 RepID=A0ABW2Y483_9BIFI